MFLEPSRAIRPSVSRLKPRGQQLEAGASGLRGSLSRPAELLVSGGPSLAQMKLEDFPYGTFPNSYGDPCRDSCSRIGPRLRKLERLRRPRRCGMQREQGAQHWLEMLVANLDLRLGMQSRQAS